MSILDEILRQQVALQELGANPKRVVLSVASQYKLLMELAPIMRFPRINLDGKCYIAGMELVRQPYSAYCHGCGAPAETPRCSYCHRPAEYVQCI